MLSRAISRRPAARLRSGAPLLAAALLSAAPFAAASNNSVPDWVKTAAGQTLPLMPESTRAIVLLNESTYTVAPDGSAVEHVRQVVKILRPQGRRYGYPFVPFDKDSKILSMHVWSIDPAGHEYALKDNEISEVAIGASFELYSDTRAKVADPPGRDPGGVVAYEYEKRERPYLAETNWFFQDEVPRLNQSFTLVLPPGYTYTTAWAHHSKIDAIDLEHQRYRWEMNNQRAIDLDQVPLSPSAESLAARLSIHYTGPGMTVPQDGTWQGIGQWYQTLSRDRVASAPDIAAKAAELTAGKSDFYDKAAAIGSFVQGQIRYVAIEIGVGGFQPHPADDVFRGRYGDCKDKATLLAAMLSSVGIHSTLMMVDTQRGVVDPAAPSIVGNHMIGAIEIPAGYDSPRLHSVITAKTGKRFLIFDPTWEKIPFGQLEDNLQGSYGILMEGPDSQIVQLPVLDPQLNTVHRAATLQLSTDGSLKGAIIERRFGDLAESGREVFTHEDAKKQQEYVDRSVSKDLMAASLSGLRVENVSALDKDLTTSFDLQASHFASVAGPLLMVRPRVYGSYALPVDRELRSVAIDLRHTMQGTDEFDIQLPDNYTVDELPDPVKVDVGFASYQSSTELRGHVLHYSRTFTLRQVSLPADKYPDLQRLEALITADEDSRAILKHGN